MPAFIATALDWLLTTRAGRIAMLIGGALLALKISNMRGASRGRAAARDEMEDADHDRAEEIRAAADAARVAGAADGRPVDERLRENGQFRD